MALQMARAWIGRRRHTRPRLSLAEQVRRQARRIVITVIGLVFITCTLCLVLGLLVEKAFAQDQADAGMDVMLIIDNSNSMFDKGGIGSDPELRRIEAAQLFITYLGVDSGITAHQVGVIGYGGRAEEVLPLTSLADEDRRHEMAELIANPRRMAWTNPAAALRLAQQALIEMESGDRRQAVVLLTDGKPEWDSTPTASERAEIVADLRQIGTAYAEEGVQLFILLLGNTATDADPEIAEVYVPLWRELGEATGGRFYAVRGADGLIDIYHDVLLTLSGVSTDGAVVDVALSGGLERRVINVEPNLRRVTFVIRVVQPQASSMVVTLTRPDGRGLHSGEAGVRHTAYGTTAIWAVDNPEAGDWVVTMEGQGSVTVWKDYIVEPVPTPVPTAAATPVPTPTALPTATVTPRPTPTPAPTILVPGLPETAFLGAPVTVTVRLRPATPAGANAWAAWSIAGGSELDRILLLDDGRAGDRTGGDGILSGVWIADTAGVVEVRIWYEIAGREMGSWVGRVRVETVPRLSMDVPPDGTTWRTGRSVALTARWMAGKAPVDAGGVVTITMVDATGAVVSTATGTPGKALMLAVPDTTGTYTVSAQAADEGSDRPRISDVISFEVQVRHPFPVWALGAGIAGAAALGAGPRVYAWASRRPQLVGTLRVLSRPTGYTGAMVEDLSILRTRRLQLGGRRGPFGLPDQPSVWGELDVVDGDGYVALTAGTGPSVMVNNRITQRVLLHDGDVIEVGDLRLRYECLKPETS